MNKFFIAILLVLYSIPVHAYQVKTTRNGIQVKPGPGLRSGRPIDRLLANKRVQLLATTRSSLGKLWCKVELPSGKKGWIDASFVNPILNENIPLTIQEIPELLFIAYVQNLLKTIPMTAKSNKEIQLLTSIIFLKQEWALSKSRLDFFDLARRVKISISQKEYHQIENQMELLEKRFHRAVTNYQLLF